MAVGGRERKGRGERVWRSAPPHQDLGNGPVVRRGMRVVYIGLTVLAGYADAPEMEDEEAWDGRWFAGLPPEGRRWLPRVASRLSKVRGWRGDGYGSEPPASRSISWIS